MKELLLTVPAPFSGTDDVGFSARYPAQATGERLLSVPLFIEGPPRPMHRLVSRLELFRDKTAMADPIADDEAYAWTEPIQLTDEVCIIAFRDLSLGESTPADAAGRRYLWNLVRPLAFTFLRDCVRFGGLRLAERIEVVVDSGTPPTVELELQRTAIFPSNGTLLLAD